MSKKEENIKSEKLSKPEKTGKFAGASKPIKTGKFAGASKPIKTSKTIKASKSIKTSKSAKSSKSPEKNKISELNSKQEMNRKQKTGELTEIEKIARILTGEKALEEKRKKIEHLKKAEIEKRKQLQRIGGEKGNLKLEELKDDEVVLPPKKVVQNIKLFSWEAPERRPLKYSSKSFLSVVALCLIFMVYLTVVGQYFLMIVIIALLFMLYTLGVSPIVKLKHTITARGLDVFGKLFEWFMLDEFWFTNKEKSTVLQVSTNLRFPARLTMLVADKDRGAIFALLQDKLLYKDIKKQIQSFIAEQEQLKYQQELLVSIPGVGELTAAKLLAEIQDVEHFDHAKQLAAYAGVTPQQHS